MCVYAWAACASEFEAETCENARIDVGDGLSALPSVPKCLLVCVCKCVCTCVCACCRLASLPPSVSLELFDMGCLLFAAFGLSAPPCARAMWPRYIHLRVLCCLFLRMDGRLSPRIGPCCETWHIMCQPLSEGIAWCAGSHGASRAACARLGLRVRIARHAQLAHGAQRVSSEFELRLHLRGFLVLRIVVCVCAMDMFQVCTLL